MMRDVRFVRLTFVICEIFCVTLCEGRTYDVNGPMADGRVSFSLAVTCGFVFGMDI